MTLLQSKENSEDGRYLQLPLTPTKIALSKKVEAYNKVPPGTPTKIAFSKNVEAPCLIPIRANSLSYSRE